MDLAQVETVGHTQLSDAIGETQKIKSPAVAFAPEGESTAVGSSNAPYLDTAGDFIHGKCLAQLSPEQLAFIQATVDAVVRATVPPKITSASNTSELFSSWLGSRESVQTERAYRNASKLLLIATKVKNQRKNQYFAFDYLALLNQGMNFDVLKFLNPYSLCASA